VNVHAGIAPVQTELPAPGLKVLAFTDYLFEGSCGGAERVFREVYKRLIEWGVEVKVLTTSPSSEPGPGEVDGIPVVQIKSLDLTRALGAQVSLAPALVPEALRMAARFKPDVLHANGLHFQTSIAAAVCHQRRGIPMVTTAHIGNSELLKLPLRLATRMYEHSISKYILNGSDRVIAVAPSVADHMRTLKVPSTDIEVILNGVDHGRFAFEGARPRSDNDPIVIFVGRLIQNKGPQVFLEAVSLLKTQGVRFRAVFLGEGPMRKELEARVAQEKLSDMVEFAGPVDDVAPWLGRASVLVRPSFTEGLPLTVLEAMASKVTVIASDIPGNNDLIRDGQNGLLFPAGNSGELAGRLSLALGDPLLGRRLARAARESSYAYSWDACAAATMKVLAKSASRAHR